MSVSTQKNDQQKNEKNNGVYGDLESLQWIPHQNGHRHYRIDPASPGPAWLIEIFQPLVHKKSLVYQQHNLSLSYAESYKCFFVWDNGVVAATETHPATAGAAMAQNSPGVTAAASAVHLKTKRALELIPPPRQGQPPAEGGKAYYVPLYYELAESVDELNLLIKDNEQIWRQGVRWKVAEFTTLEIFADVKRTNTPKGIPMVLERRIK